MFERVAIVGAGYTPFRSISPEVSYRELIFEAAVKAYNDADASPGMCILHNMGELSDDIEEIKGLLKIRIPVKAVWKPADLREGSITDIEYFKLVG